MNKEPNKTSNTEDLCWNVHCWHKTHTRILEQFIHPCAPYSASIYILCFVCLYPINVKTAKSIGTKFCLATYMAQILKNARKFEKDEKCRVSKQPCRESKPWTMNISNWESFFWFIFIIYGFFLTFKRRYKNLRCMFICLSYF